MMKRPKPLGNCSNCKLADVSDQDYCAAMEAYADHLERLVTQLDSLVTGLQPQWLEGFKKLCNIDNGDAVLLEFDPDIVKREQLKLLGEHMAKSLGGAKLFAVQKGMTAHNLTANQSSERAAEIVRELRSMASKIEQQLPSKMSTEEAFVKAMSRSDHPDHRYGDDVL